MVFSGPADPVTSTDLRALGVRRRAWCVVASACVLTVLCVVLAGGTWGRLVSGGFDASDTEAVRAEAYVADHFAAGSPQLVLLAEAHVPVETPAVARAGRTLAEQLRADPGVLSVRSYWSDADPGLRSTSGDAALVTAVLVGDDGIRTATARKVVPELTGRHGPLDVSATGTAWTATQATDRSEHDLLRAELFTAPLVYLVLVFAFRSALAALLPVLVAAVSSVLTLALLRPLASLMPVSVFATNLTTALGFGLAVDYCLFLLTRYRQETARGHAPAEAIGICLRTAGRAVIFSVATIALAMGALFVFPVDFLRSMGCAGILVTVCAGLVSLILLPALVLLLGSHLERWDPLRRTAKPQGADADARSWQVSPGWRRVARAVCRRPVLLGTAALAVLFVLATPLTRLALGPIDVRTLPRSEEAHMVADKITDAFPAMAGTTAVVALPSGPGLSDASALDTYARTLSALGSVQEATTATGHYQGGRRVSEVPPSTYARAEAAWVSLRLQTTPDSSAAANAVRRIRAEPVVGTAWVGGDAARFGDTKRALRDALLPATALIALATGVLLFLFTGSVFIPLKAVLVGALSLGACSGAVVWVFQYGHGAELLGVSTLTGTVDACMLLLVFCVAFGLSMDYEVFLLSRIQEEYLRTGDNRLSVERGIECTGRLVTVAALAVAIAMAALVTSGITLLKQLGFGLAFAVMIDATLVRAVLVPAAMCVAGRANWWAPGVLRQVHGRIGLREPRRVGKAGGSS